MRDLDEALARLARRDQLQKRNSNGQHARPRAAADEVAEALRQVAERHPGLAAVVRLDEGDSSTEIRVTHEAGTVRVTTIQHAPPAPLAPASLDPAPPQPSPLALAPLPQPRLDPDPLDAPLPIDPAPVAPAALEPAPFEPAPFDPAPFDPTPFDPTPFEPAPFEPAPVEPASFDPPSFDAASVEPASVDPAPLEPSPFGEFRLSEPLPMRPVPTDRLAADPVPPAPDVLDGQVAPAPAGPPEWPLRTEATPGSAEARLAELVRQDPSLLDRRTER